ncbi:MAG: hypothetical protein HRF49_03265 [bacterium]|jgi:hypothetical protein
MSSRIFLSLCGIFASLIAGAAAQDGSGIAAGGASAFSGPIRISGGDWRWEFEGGKAKGVGRGTITITWGELTANAESVTLSKPPVVVELTGGVKARWRDSEFLCAELRADEDANAVMARDVVAEFVEPALSVAADEASLAGAFSNKTERRVAAFRGNVEMNAAEFGSVATGEAKYYPDEGLAEIPEAFSGAIPMFFVKDPENPFYGETASVSGDSISAVMGPGGEILDAACERISIESPSGSLYAPTLALSTDKGLFEIVARASPSEKISGHFIAPDGRKADFSCSRFSARERSRQVSLSGRVEVTGEGITLLSEFVLLAAEGDGFRILSTGGNKLSLEDLFIGQGA